MMIIVCSCGACFSLSSFLIADWITRVLFDSGSPFSFICESFTTKIGERSVRLAFHHNVMILSGEHSLTWKYLRLAGIILGGTSFKTSLIVINMREYDVILDID